MTIRVDVLLPTLSSRLVKRAASSIAAHGADNVEIRFIVISKDHVLDEIQKKGLGENFVLVSDTEPAGVNAALRLGLKEVTGDHIVVACDDVIYQPGWLGKIWGGYNESLNRHRSQVIVGIRHAGGIGTAWGRMYANFPIFARRLLDNPYLKEHFMPEWLRGQWGDVAFSLAVWHVGGCVVDSNTGPLIAWADRLGEPEASTKGVSSGADMSAIQERFGPVFGHGWPTEFRGFNIDCPPGILRNGTVCIPRQQSFMEEYRRAVTGVLR